MDYYCDVCDKTFKSKNKHLQSLTHNKIEYYIKQPMQILELNLKMIINNNPHLINVLDRSINHPLIRKYSNIPFMN